jgi:hypothetical protein
MVAMAGTHAHSPQSDKESEIVEIVEEVIKEVGVRGLITACLKSTGGEEVEEILGRLIKSGATQVTGPNALRIAHVVLREIIISADPQLEAEIMALGVGLVMEGETMGTIGNRHGITKQAVSKRVVAFADENKLPPSVYMRSEKDRKTYAMTNQPRSK